MGILNAVLFLGCMDCKGCDQLFYFNFSNLQYSVGRIYVLFCVHLKLMSVQFS